MSSRKGRVRHSVRNRPGGTLGRHRSWEDPERMMMEVEPGRQAKIKNCCRSLATFMCTQVGVGGIIVGYAIVGAFGFMALETQEHSVTDTVLENVTKCREQTALRLWADYLKHPFNETEWDQAANKALHAFQKEVVSAVKKGYDGRNVKEQWNFPAALMFTLSIFTMIGYGNLVPRTQWGKVITIFYAVFGIPLYILYFMNMGRALAGTFKWIYIKLNSCSVVTMQVEENGRGENGEGNTTVEGSLEYSNSPRRFIHVEGYDGRKNDIVYCRPLIESDKAAYEINGDSESDTQPGGNGIGNRTKVVVFFGGDIQDFTEMMEMHRDHRQYSNWNLEATARLLQRQFPNHHIVVVRPSRIQMLTFSCYDNFVHCNNTGVPDHVINYYALFHLETLLKNLSELIETEGDQVVQGNKENNSSTNNTKSGDDEDSIVSSTTHEEVSNGVDVNNSKLSHSQPVNPHFDRAEITLVGFSKGCVVLNQLIYEFHYMKTLTPDDLTMDVFLKCIKDMYWLDGGHNGGKNTWITSRSLLETLTRLGIRVHVHMTPYQLADERRPWIRREEKIFSDFLKRFDAPISRHVHFENEIASLDLHLQLVAQFASPENPPEENPNQTPHTSALSI